MKQFSYSITGLDELQNAVHAIHEDAAVKQASSILFEVFSSDPQEAYIRSAIQIIQAQFPDACIVGSSTSGEIVNEDVYEHTTALSCMVFETSTVHTFGYDCHDSQEKEAGRSILGKVRTYENVKGLQILSDTKTMDNASLLDELRELPKEIVVFGGGADAYENGTHTIVFNKTEIYTHGAVGAVFCGSELYIEGLSSLGWKPLGIGRTVTEVDTSQGALLKTIDHQPAINIYEKYLHFKTTQDFHEHVDIFPMMVSRNGYDLARVPIDSRPDGSIYLGADVNVGEKIRLAYADPQVLIEKSFRSAEKIASFRPQGILLFCCITRKGFLKEYANTDAKPFAEIAPTAGFYTYGEIMRLRDNVITMNCTLVCVGIREGEPKGNQAEISKYKVPLKGHMSAMERLVNFVEVTTADLEEANHQLAYYAQHDRLTDVLNRGEIEKYLREVVDLVERDIYHASAIMIDVDHFKTVNDTYGHAYGDYVLKTISEILKNSRRKTDKAGRWGGDEFMMVLPGEEEKDALVVAERIRKAIAEYPFKDGHQVTVSIGVSEIKKGEELLQFYNRVDQALYHAKAENRNKVIKM